MLPVLKKIYLIRGVAAAKTVNTGDTITSVEFQKQKAQEFNQNWS